MMDVETFRQLALSFPGASEKLHFDRPSFRVNKIFATLDLPNSRACLMLTEVDQSVFCEFNPMVFYPVPNKWGKHGATYVELKTVRKTMMKDALAQAYQKCIEKKSKTKSTAA